MTKVFDTSTVQGLKAAERYKSTLENRCDQVTVTAIGLTRVQISGSQKLNTYDLYWSPEGRKIATVEAATAKAAIRKAPKPYRRYLGEIYAVDKRTEHALWTGEV